MCEAVRNKVSNMEKSDRHKESVPAKSEIGDYNDIRSQAPSMRSKMSNSVGGNRHGPRVYHVDHSAKMNPTEEEWNSIVEKNYKNFNDEK